jgi:3-oxo-5-alpha-steroid 4-dehydrogenase 1
MLYTVAVFVMACFADSPYGKLASNDPGETKGLFSYILNVAIKFDPRFGWWLMEFPASLSFLIFYFQGPRAFEPVRLFFAFLWVVHYGNRGWFFPLSIRVAPGQTTSFSLWIVVFGMLFTSMHGYLNARWFSGLATHINHDWFHDWRFIVGFCFYEVSFWATIHCEYIMRNLRSPNPSQNEPRYKIPKSGLFEYCTSPQYFCELCAWLSWAIMTKNPGGVVVFLISAANLVPRAYTQHEWYLEKFKDTYPKNRTRLIPYVW